jgi:hypothetical protein
MVTRRSVLGAVLLVAGGMVTLAQHTADGSSRSQTPAITTYHIYNHFFGSVTFLKQRAEEFTQQGKTSTQLRSYYRNRVSLSQSQAEQLEIIAVDCTRELEQQDAKARTLIAAARARYPHGRLLEGEQPPSPPVELLELQKGREDIVMRARERLRQSFGEQEFSRVEQFLQANFAPKIQVLSIDQAIAAAQRTSGAGMRTPSSNNTRAK